MLTTVQAANGVPTAMVIGLGSLLVCNCGGKPFGLNGGLWGCLCREAIDAASLVHFPRERQIFQSFVE